MEVEYKNLCEDKRYKSVKSDIKIKTKKQYKESRRPVSPDSDYYIRPKRVLRLLRKNDIREDFRLNDKFVNKVGKNIDR